MKLGHGATAPADDVLTAAAAAVIDEDGAALPEVTGAGPAWPIGAIIMYDPWPYGPCANAAAGVDDDDAGAAAAEAGGAGAGAGALEAEGAAPVLGTGMYCIMAP